MAELQFRESAAAGYDRAVGHMTRQLLPPLLRAARLALGMRVLDIATGTGIAAEAALRTSRPRCDLVEVPRPLLKRLTALACYAA